MQNSPSVGSGRAVFISSNKFPREVNGPGILLRTVEAGVASAASAASVQTLLRSSCRKLPAGNVFLPAPANDMVQM